MLASPLAGRLRTILAAGRLGWSMESNWADPFVFAIYFLVRPIATSLILVVMYRVVTDGAFGTPFFAGLYLGNAFFQYVGQVLFGVSAAVQEDREHYQMLRYVWSAPISTLDYLLGRGLTKMATGTLSVAVTLLFGVLFLDLSLVANPASIILVAFSLLSGLVLLVSLGVAMAGVELNRSHSHLPLQEGIAGVLYLCSGAVFPPEVLPAPLRAISYALPTTWWIESLRRALLGEGWCATLSSLADAEVAAVLVGLVLLYSVPSLYVYRWLDRRARRLNRLDWTTGF